MIFFQDDITIESSIIPSIERKTQEINHYISLPGLVGSLSGNDTVFLAMRDNAAAETLVREGRSLFMG